MQHETPPPPPPPEPVLTAILLSNPPPKPELNAFSLSKEGGGRGHPQGNTERSSSLDRIEFFQGGLGKNSFALKWERWSYCLSVVTPSVHCGYVAFKRTRKGVGKGWGGRIQSVLDVVFGPLSLWIILYFEVDILRGGGPLGLHSEEAKKQDSDLRRKM